MIIQKLTASFGGLQQQQLELGAGLTVLQGPNETGKSTWCAFLRSMLYGINTRERDRQGYLAEKNRYQPWSGAPMEGEMTLQWQGRTVIVRRFSKGNTPFGGFSAIDQATGEPVPGLDTDTLGERLTGVGRETFERTCFVGQGGIRVNQSGELEGRIAALVSSGEEEVSYSQVERRLKDWQNRRRHNKTGLIPKLGGELEQLNILLERLDQTHLRLESNRQELQRVEARRNELDAQVKIWQRLDRHDRYGRYRQAMEELDQAQRQISELEDQPLPAREMLRKAQEDLAYLRTLDDQRKQGEQALEDARQRAEQAQSAVPSPYFPDLDADQAWQQASAHAAQGGQAPSYTGKWVQVGLAVLGGALCGALAFLQAIPLLYGGAALCVLAALLLGVWMSRDRARGEEARQALLASYQAQCPEDILKRAMDYRQRCVAAAQAKAQVETAEQTLTQLNTRWEGTCASLLAFVHTFTPSVTDLFGVSAALSRALSQREQLATARARLDGARKLVDSLARDGVPVPEQGPRPNPPEHDITSLSAWLAESQRECVRLQRAMAMEQGELNTMGDPAFLTARRGELKGALAQRRQEHEAITLALEALAQANGQLRARFSPALNQSAGEIMAALTGGKYDRVSLQRDFEALAGETGDILPRRSLFLSQGTADQLYLAVRLAVCDLLLPQDESVPLVLDDALTAFDDVRMGLALDYLLQLSQQRQILFFTCHNRERKYLAGRPGVTGLDLH